MHHAITSNHLPAGPATSKLVFRAMYKQGLTLCAFVQPKSVSDPSQDLLQESLTAYSTDIRMSGSQGSLETRKQWCTEAYHEQVSLDVLQQNAQVWAMAEERADPLLSEEEEEIHLQTFLQMRTHGQSKKPVVEPVVLNELATQHVLPRRRLLVLTSAGLWLVLKNTPLHVLHGLLGSKNTSSAQMEAWVLAHGVDEACAMLLRLACCQSDLVSSTPEDIGPHPTNPFALASSPSKQARHIPVVARNALHWLLHIGYGLNKDNNVRTWPVLGATTNAPTKKPSASSGAGGAVVFGATLGETSSNLVYSGCYTGLVLYLSRLLRPLWTWHVFTSKVMCRWSNPQLSLILTPLMELKTCMQKDQPFCEQIKANKTSASPSAYELEALAVHQVYTLLDHIVQIVQLFLLLTSTSKPLSSLMTSLSASDKTSMLGFTWNQLVLSSHAHKMLVSLTKALLQDADVGTKELTASVQTRCPLFFSSSDALHVRALQEVRLARTTQFKQRDTHEQAAMGLFVQAFTCDLAGVDRLQEAASSLFDLSASKALFVCVQCGQNVAHQDKQDLAMLPSQPSEVREKAYALALGVLAKCGSGAEFEQALQVALQRFPQDVFWHFSLYAWLLTHDYVEYVVGLPASSFVARFLLKEHAPKTPTHVPRELYAK